MAKWHRKYTKEHINNHSPKPKKHIFRFVFYTILSISIFLLVYSLIFQPKMISNTYNKVANFVEINYDKIKTDVNNTIKEDPQLNLCKSKYKELLSLREQKYGLEATFLKAEKINNYEEAKGFLETWGSDNLISKLISNRAERKLLEIKDYPIIMLASRLEMVFFDYREIGPSVSYCNANGEISYLD